MAKLLLITPGLPYPPMQGTALRNWGIISGLAPRHRITLLSFARPAAAAAPELLAACERVVLVPSRRAAHLRALQPWRSPHSRIWRGA